MAALVRRTLLLGSLAAAAAWGNDFLGAESCEACHPDAWAAWQTSSHARSRDVLSPQQQKDARCLTCHSPNEADQRVAQVSCETCHGGGQYYSAKYVMKDAELARLAGLVDSTEKACRACHDASSPSLRPFDFKEKVKAIDHWSIERKKREQKITELEGVGPAESLAGR
jgi:hypothetical protein